MSNNPPKVYVASSWRNTRYPVELLRTRIMNDRADAIQL